MSAVMASAVGEDAIAASWHTTAEAMEEAFRAFVLVPADSYEKGTPAYVPDICVVVDATTCTPTGISQAAQTEAIIAGLLSREEAAGALNFVFTAPHGDPPVGVSRWNNPTYLYRSLKALSMAGRHELALAHLRERFSQYLPGNPYNPVDPVLQGPIGGPLPEYWISRIDLNLTEGEICNPQPSDGTGSHGWTGVALLWMHDSLLGVEEPGSLCGGFAKEAERQRYAFACGNSRRLQVAPEDAGLDYLSGRTYTSIGVVAVDWRPAGSDESAWRLELTLPEAEDPASPDAMADIWTPQRCVASSSSWTVQSIPDSASVMTSGTDYITVQGHGTFTLLC